MQYPQHIPVQFVPVYPVLVQLHVYSSGWDPNIHTPLLSQGVSAFPIISRPHNGSQVLLIGQPSERISDRWVNR